MLWNEVRKTYPNKWIVFDSLKQYEEENKLIIEDVAIIEVFEDINDVKILSANINVKNMTLQLNS